MRLTPPLNAQPVSVSLPVVAVSTDRAGMKTFFRSQNLKYTEFQIVTDEGILANFRRMAQSEPSLKARSEYLTWQERLQLDIGEKYGPMTKAGEIADLAICRINDRVGFGAFAASSLAKGAFIGTYTGFVSPVHLQNPRSLYLANLTPPWEDTLNARAGNGKMPYMVVDAFALGNETRFLNHAHHASMHVRPDGESVNTANVGYAHIIFAGAWHLALIANRDIAPGEELRFDYGDDYQASHRSLVLTEETYHLVDGELVEIATRREPVSAAERRQRNVPLYPS